MKRNSEFDEKQQLERGKAYRNGFFTLLALLLVSFFISDGLELHWLDSASLFHIFFWVSFAVCAITMIVKDAYDGISGSSGRVALSIIGIAGLAVLVTTCIELARNQTSWDSCIGMVVMGLCGITTSVVYWAKKISNRKYENE